MSTFISFTRHTQVTDFSTRSIYLLFSFDLKIVNQPINRGAGSYLQQSLCHRQGTLWVASPSQGNILLTNETDIGIITRIYWHFKITSQPQIVCFWSVSGKQNTKRKPIDAQGKHAKITQKRPGRRQTCNMFYSLNHHFTMWRNNESNLYVLQTPQK